MEEINSSTGMIDCLMAWKPEIAKKTIVEIKEIEMDIIPIHWENSRTDC